MMMMMMKMIMMMMNFPWVSFGETLGQSARKSVWIRRQKCGCGTANDVLRAQGRKQFIHVCKTSIRNPSTRDLNRWRLLSWLSYVTLLAICVNCTETQKTLNTVLFLKLTCNCLSSLTNFRKSVIGNVRENSCV